MALDENKIFPMKIKKSKTSTLPYLSNKIPTI